MDIMQPPRAYSYLRFGTPEQAKGHSLERQTEAARAWAAASGVMLDDELTFKEGVSGFTTRDWSGETAGQRVPMPASAPLALNQDEP